MIRVSGEHRVYALNRDFIEVFQLKRGDNSAATTAAGCRSTRSKTAAKSSRFTTSASKAIIPTRGSPNGHSSISAHNAGCKLSGAGGPSQAADRLHHAWPQYLGGLAKQSLQKLSKELHDLYHSGLDKVLPRQIKGGATAYYASLSGAEQSRNFQKLMEYTKAFDAAHGTGHWRAIVHEATGF